MIISEELYLAHHGVKGQKWGVIRTPEQLGHRPHSSNRHRPHLSNNHTVGYSDKISKDTISNYGEDYENMSMNQLDKILKSCVNTVDHTSYKHPDIPAGTELYRTTASDVDYGRNGYMYVSYTDRDRQFYKGPGLDWISGIEYQNSQAENRERRKLKENIYKTTKNLKIASRSEVVDIVVDKILNDNEVKKSVGKDFIIKNEDVMNAYLKAENYKKLHPNKVKKIDKLVDQYSKKYNEAMLATLLDTDKNPRVYAEKFIQDIGANEFYKKSVGEELKKRGYDGMADVYGVGEIAVLKGRSYSENGNDPLIIFESESKVKQMSSKQITAKEYDEANDKSDKYMAFIEEYAYKAYNSGERAKVLSDSNRVLFE